MKRLLTATFVEPVKRRFGERFSRWLNKRIPPSREIQLQQDRIFIFPTRYGLFYLFTCLILFIGGANYQNSLILALSFFLTSLFLVTILHTYQNISGLILKAGRAESTFAGEDALFEVITVRGGERSHFNVRLHWKAGKTVTTSIVELKQTYNEILVKTRRRGVFNPGRLRVDTYFPLGLMRTWTWVDLAMDCLVYPKPIEQKRIPTESGMEPDGNEVVEHGSEDFYELRKYAVGDPLKHVSWKHYAKGQGLYSKRFVAYQNDSCVLDFQFAEGSETELKLSHLCYWVLRLSENNQEFGLRLPGLAVPPGSGPSHEKHCLAVLAKYQLGGTSVSSETVNQDSNADAKTRSSV